MFGKEIRKLKWEIDDLKKDVEVLKTCVQVLQYELEANNADQEKESNVRADY